MKAPFLSLLLLATLALSAHRCGTRQDPAPASHTANLPDGDYHGRFYDPMASDDGGTVLLTVRNGSFALIRSHARVDFATLTGTIQDTLIDGPCIRLTATNLPDIERYTLAVVSQPNDSLRLRLPDSMPRCMGSGCETIYVLKRQIN